MDVLHTHERSHAPRTGASEPQRILVATDLGPVGESAIRVAHARAEESGGKLAVCHVIADPPTDPAELARRTDEVRVELARILTETLGAHASEAEQFVLAGDAAKQIHDCAETWNAQLVVLGRPEHASGILARLFRPKVVDRVVRWSPCAVLVTRRAPGTRRIVVGIDFADPSQAVLRAAAEEQARTGASVYAVHCVPPAALFPVGDPSAGVVPAATWDEIEGSMEQRIAEAATAAGLQAAPQIVRDAAADGLVQLARDLAADLVIVGTHGRGGIARIALGSIAEHVVNHAPCPVLVVRLPEA